MPGYDGATVEVEWHAIAGAEKITMRLERDIVRFFRAMGPNYQAKMARVLKAWMHGRLAKAVMGPDTTDIVLRPEEVETQIAHLPYWGEDGTLHGVQRFMEGVAFYQSLRIDHEEGKEVPRGKAFQAAMLEAALKGTGLEV